MSTNFKFKAERKYVHGTDMFNFMVSGFRQSYMDEVVLSLSMSINRKAKDDCRLLILNSVNDLKAPDNVVAKMLIKTCENKYLLFLVETDTEIIEKYDYDEDSIAKIAVIENDSISTFELSAYSIIETIVALNKAMLTKLCPDVPGKWFFTRIEIKEYKNFLLTKNIKLTLIKKGMHNMVKSSISINGENIGNIFFTSV